MARPWTQSAENNRLAQATTRDVGLQRVRLPSEHARSIGRLPPTRARVAGTAIPRPGIRGEATSPPGSCAPGGRASRSASSVTDSAPGTPGGAHNRLFDRLTDPTRGGTLPPAFVPEGARSMMQADLADLRVLSAGLDHPEGVTRGPDGFLYAGGEAGQIYKISPEGGPAEVIANVGGFVLGLCCDADSAVYACSWDAGSSRVARIGQDGAISTYCDSAN